MGPIEGIEQAKKEAQAQLGTWVGGSLQGAVLVASFIVPTDPLDVVLPVGGKVFKTLKFAEKARAAYAPLVNKFLDAWRARRVAKGKSANVAVRYVMEVTNGGQKGTKTPGVNYEPDEAGETIKYGSRLGYCFVAGTPVVMADGTTKAIEDVKEGDQVMSRDEVTGETDSKEVVQLFERLAFKTLVLQFAGGERIECTPEHPFYVAGRGFVKAGELGIGNSIVTRAGPSVAIEDIKLKNVPTTVFNFEVAEFHTYFVGKVSSGLWVHNDCLTDRMAKGHAYEKHVMNSTEFDNMIGGPIVTQAQYSDLIQSVMRSPIHKRLANVDGSPRGATAYFDESRGILAIIHDADYDDFQDLSTCYRATFDQYDDLNSLSW